MRITVAGRSTPSARRVIVLLTSMLLVLPGGSLATDAVEIRLGTTSYRIELADTPQQRQQGLMHRPNIAPNQGMLLVYPAPGDHRIWMKNVLIPLRVYWIDAAFTVISEQRLEPCPGPPCPVYGAARDSLFVLELGDYRHPLAPGDRIDALGNL